MVTGEHKNSVQLEMFLGLLTSECQNNDFM